MSGFNFGFTSDELSLSSGIGLNQDLLRALYKISGNAYLVSPTGNDNNDGVDGWSNALVSINEAMSRCSTGDGILLAPGDFDENANGATGVLCNVSGIKITGVGADRLSRVNNTDTSNNGATFTITAIGVEIENISIIKLDFVSTGSACVICDGAINPVINNCNIGVLTTQTGVIARNAARGVFISAVGSLNSAIIGVGVGASRNGTGVNIENAVLCSVGATGFAALETGVVFGAGANTNIVIDNSFFVNCDIGISIEPGAVSNIPGGRKDNCGIDVDDQSGNDTNANREAEHHQHAYPIPAGEGVAADPVTVLNQATDDTPVSRDDENYWGDTVLLLPVSTLTAEWRSLGMEFFANVANKFISWQVFFPDPAISSTRNGGNAWSLGETVLTVVDGSVFVVGDFVWIASTSDPNGEILEITDVTGNVITIASETRASGNTGIRYNHVGAETMYLVRRDTSSRWHPIEMTYSAASTKEFTLIDWHEPKLLQPNTGMIMRVLNASDDLSVSVDVKHVYED